MELYISIITVTLNVLAFCVCSDGEGSDWAGSEDRRQSCSQRANIPGEPHSPPNISCPKCPERGVPVSAGPGRGSTTVLLELL